MESSESSLVRLQKALADAGVGSRRHCELLIDQGRVSLNGEVVRRQGVRVDPTHDVLHVDGERVVSDATRRYVALNKPVGVLSTMSDDRGRPTLEPATRGHRLFHVGRLDLDTAGLLLMTNDGELAHRLMHPSYAIPKIYVADVEGRVTSGERSALRNGILLDDGEARADAARIVASAQNRTLVELTVHDGRNRLVRRMLESIGHPVIDLVRVAFGPVALGDLRAGRSRALNRHEVSSLYELVDL